MTNNAQLLPLPVEIWNLIGKSQNAADTESHISAMWARDAVEKAIKAYALACIEAAKPADALVREYVQSLLNNDKDTAASATCQMVDYVMLKKLDTYEAAQGEKT